MQFEAIIERINIYKGQILSNKRWWILLAFLFAILLGIYAVTSPKYYTAETVFHPEGGSGANAALANNPLALILGGATGGGQSGMMIGALKSRNISEAVAKDSICINDKTMLVADLIMENMNQGFSLTKWFRNLFLKKPPVPSKEAKAIVAGSFIRYGIVVIANDDGYIVFNFTNSDRNITEVVSQIYIAKLREYYEIQKTSKAQKNIDFFSHRADSVRKELEKTSRALARYQDRNKYRIFTESEIYVQEQSVKLEMLTQMHNALIISKEQAISQKLQETPIINVLDFPAPPFTTSKKSLSLYIFLGLFLGGFIGIAWICRNLLKEDAILLIKESMKPLPEEKINSVV